MKNVKCGRFDPKNAVDIAVSMELTNKEIAKISSKAKPVQKLELHVTIFVAASRQNDKNCVTRGIERDTIHIVHRRCLPNPQLKGNLNNFKLSKGRKRRKE